MDGLRAIQVAVFRGRHPKQRYVKVKDKTIDFHAISWYLCPRFAPFKAWRIIRIPQPHVPEGVSYLTRFSVDAREHGTLFINQKKALDHNLILNPGPRTGYVGRNENGRLYIEIPL
jgi:hypothetical protein